MKLHQEDPRLTAYALGELPPEERAAVERALASDPALRAALAETEAVRDSLTGALGGEVDSLLPRHREAIRRATKEAARQGRVENLRSHRQAQRRWLAPMAAAAVILGGVFLLMLIPSGGGGAGSGGTKPVTANRDPVEGGGLEPGEAATRDRGNVTLLPLKASGKSLALVTEAIRGGKRLPAKEEARIPELLNAFPLKATGSAALWSGCKLGAEILPAPWKPSASLVFVEIQGAKEEARAVSVEYRAEEGAVISHRLLGYETSKDVREGGSTSEMAAGDRMLLVIEIESRALRLGSLHWSVGGKDAPPIPLVRDQEREPSDDSRFATLICAFGLWLRGEGGGMIDDALLLGLARESASGILVADRYDFLTLIDEAIKLADK